VIPVTFLVFVVQYRVSGAIDLYAAQLAEPPPEEVRTPLALAVASAVGLAVVMAVGEFAALHRPEASPAEKRCRGHGMAVAVRRAAGRQRRAWLQEAMADPKTVQKFCLPSVVALSNP
jgi:hypothetical protein